MDRTGIIVVTICVILLFTWPALLNSIKGPPPAQPTNAPPTASEIIPEPIPSSPIQSASSITPSPVPEDFDESFETLENDRAIYTFSSKGGLQSVALKRYPLLIDCNSNNEAIGARANPARVLLNHGALLPVLGNRTELSDGIPFKFSKRDSGLRLEKPLPDGLHILKEFQLSTNYLIGATVRIENRSTEARQIPAQEMIIGAAMPMEPSGTVPMWGVQWHDGEEMTEVGESWFDNRTLGCGPGNPRSNYASPPEANVVWAGVHNRFFSLVTIPQIETPDFLQVRSKKITTGQVGGKDEQGHYRPPYFLETSMGLPGKVLKPGESLVRRFTLYAGPKQYQTLQLHAQHLNSIDSVMGFDGFFGWFAKPLLRSMNGLNQLGLSYAYCIIVITIIIKILFWPLTQASTRSMKRMAEFNPQMQEIRTQYKDDPQKMNKKMMEFMRKNKINPMGGCFPILLQIPVFFGFFTMLRSAIELRGAQFLWACDLSQSDTVAEVFGFPINPLPMIMGLTMIWQSRLTPIAPNADPTQQAIMRYMPLIFIVILYNFSAGLTLYWTVQNLLTILQNKLTRSNTTAKAGAAAGPATTTAANQPKPIVRKAFGKRRNKK